MRWVWSSHLKVRDTMIDAGTLTKLGQWRMKGYAVSIGYEMLMMQSAVVEWRNLIWNTYVHPCFAVITWLVFMGKIITRRWLYEHDLIDSNDCPLCTTDVEDINHLFFACPTVTEVLNGVMEKVKLRCKAKSFDE